MINEDTEVVSTPDSTLDHADPGDDVTLRFLYQHCHAAIVCFGMMKNDEIDLVVCENHEDIIVKLREGSFRAIQVKTRDTSQSPFRSNDTLLRHAINRFCILDSIFPALIIGFDFVTNHFFWTDVDDERNPEWLLHALKARGGVSRLRKDNSLRKGIEQLSENISQPVDQVISVLLRTNLVSKKDTTISVRRDVRDVIAECPDFEMQPYAVIQEIANALISLTASASTKQLTGSIAEQYEPGVHIDQVIQEQTLAGKCLCRADIEAAIGAVTSRQRTFEPMVIQELLPIEELPSDLARMIIKMAQGGVETCRIQQTQDLVRSLQCLYLQWSNKYGTEEANSRYNDLMAVVGFDCTEARALAESDGVPYGSAMYSRLLELLRSRCQADEAKTYGCRPEQLIGVAGALTQLCKTWWSPEFELTQG